MRGWSCLCRVVRNATTRPMNISWSPPSWRPYASHSNTARAFGSTGTPVSPSRTSVPGHLSPSGRAKRFDSASCSSESTLTAYRSTFVHAPKLWARRATLNRMRGGVSDTELNELTVIPKRSPAVVAVTTATPVGNAPRASRKWRSFKVIRCPCWLTDSQQYNVCHLGGGRDGASGRADIRTNRGNARHGRGDLRHADCGRLDRA